MGMQKTDTPKGVSATNAYHRIDRVVTIKDDPSYGGDYGEARVCTYYDKAARDADPTNVLATRNFRFTPDLSGSVNTLADAYAKVKAETAQHGGFFNTGVTDIDPDA